MPTSTVTSTGRITVPKPVKDHLQITAGARIDFTIREDGQVVVSKTRSRLDELRGMLRAPGRAPISIEEMNATVERAHAKRV